MMMNEADTNDNDSSDTSDDEWEEEGMQRQRAIATAAAIAARRRRKLKLTTMLDRQEEFPWRQRNKMDALVEEYIERLGEDIHDMLGDRRSSTMFYQGLDCDRDTEKEVEVALEFFPEVLSKADEEGYYPLQSICFLDNHACNLKAVSFLTVLARAGSELETDFEEEDRGGLVIMGRPVGVDEWMYGRCDTEIVLDLLMKSSDSSYGEEHNQIVDSVLHTQLVRLKHLNLLHQEDIRRYKLVDQVCDHGYYFAEQRFRFLIEWDPTILLETVAASDEGRLPLHYAACKWSMQEFRLVIEYCIRYYPTTKGIALVFRKEDSTCSKTPKTPFQYACQKFGSATVLKVIEETLIRSSTEGTPLHIVEALIPSAIDDNIHLDCVNFLVRREPGILINLISSSSSDLKESASTTTTINNNNDDNSDSIIRNSEDDGGVDDNIDGNKSYRNGYDDGGGDDDDDNDEDNILVVEQATSNQKNGKRKRES